MIKIYAYNETYYYNLDASHYVKHIEPPCSDYGYMLHDLLRQHIKNLNEEVIDMIIGRVEETFKMYKEVHDRVGKILTSKWLRD